MRRLTLLLLLLSACSHDTSGLRQSGTPDADVDGAMAGDGGMDAARDATTDTGVADTGAADTGVADSGVDTGIADSGVDTGVADAGAPDSGCRAVAYESAGPSSDVGLFMSPSTLHGWWFQATSAFRPTELGTEVLAPDGATLLLALVPVAGPGTFPSDVIPTGAVASASVTAPSSAIPADITALITTSGTLAAGWYVLGVRVVSGMNVRRAGGDATGQTFRMTDGSQTTPNGTRRIFVRGCE
jgi:hypothetical protein